VIQGDGGMENSVFIVHIDGAETDAEVENGCEHVFTRIESFY